jgi:hypothetical protein
MLGFSGIATIEKGLSKRPKEYGAEGEELRRAGKAEDTRHIQILEYRIVED